MNFSTFALLVAMAVSHASALLPITGAARHPAENLSQVALKPSGIQVLTVTQKGHDEPNTRGSIHFHVPVPAENDLRKNKTSTFLQTKQSSADVASGAVAAGTLPASSMQRRKMHAGTAGPWSFLKGLFKSKDDGFALQNNVDVDSDYDRESTLTRGLSTWEDFKVDPQLLAGCSNIFMDVGANKGTHVRKLFEPEKYPNSPYLKVFESAFGPPQDRKKPSSESGICAFGFEANPRHARALKKVEEAYQRQGWKVKFFSPLAVGNSSGQPLNLWLNDDPHHSDWAAGVRKSGSNGGHKVEVPQTSLAEFVQAVKQHSSPGFKLMKMDIESSEYKVLPPLLEKKLLCQKALNKLTVEWHQRFLDPKEVPAAEKLQRSVESPAEGICGSDDKPTAVSDVDDESYLMDGAPLP